MRKAIFCILIIAAILAGGATFKGISMQSKMVYYCVAEWPCDDSGPNTTVEDSIGGHDGTASKNTEDMNAIGKINGALDFNGISDYLDMKNTFESTFQNSFSINCWVYITLSTPNTDTICGVMDTSGNSGVVLTIDADPIGYFNYQSNGSSFILPMDIDYSSQVYGKWVMVTAVVKKVAEDSLVGKIYINGELNAATSTQEITMSDYTSTSNFYIGAINSDGSPQILSWFWGKADNTTIHNRALSQVEIDWLYNGGDGREL